MMDLSGLDQFHETVSGPAFTVASRAEGRDVFHTDEPVDHLIECPQVMDIELGSLIVAFRGRITTYGSTGTS